MDKQALQLHEKVQKLIEQYTLDKRRLVELELALKEKTDSSTSLINQLDGLKKELKASNELNAKLSEELKGLKLKNQSLEKEVDLFEGFADDLTSKIDELIPKIDKL